MHPWYLRLEYINNPLFVKLKNSLFFRTLPYSLYRPFTSCAFCIRIHTINVPLFVCRNSVMQNSYKMIAHITRINIIYFYNCCCFMHVFIHVYNLTMYELDIYIYIILIQNNYPQKPNLIMRGRKSRESTTHYYDDGFSVPH